MSLEESHPLPKPNEGRRRRPDCLAEGPSAHESINSYIFQVIKYAAFAWSTIPSTNMVLNFGQPTLKPMLISSRPKAFKACS
jgi:hypothetical protein